MTTIDDVNKNLERILDALKVNKNPNSESGSSGTPSVAGSINSVSSTLKGDIGGFINGIGDLASLIPGWGKAIGVAIKATSALVTAFIDAAKALNSYTAESYKYNTQMYKIQLDAEYQKKELMNQSVMDMRQFDIDKKLKTLQNKGEDYIQGLQVQMKQFVAAFETPMNVMTKGINEAAYEAMRQKIDIGFERQKYERDVKIRGKQLEYFTEAKAAETSSKITKNYAKANETEVNKLADLRQTVGEQRYAQKKHWIIEGLHNLIGNENVALKEDELRGVENLSPINQVKGRDKIKSIKPVIDRVDEQYRNFDAVDVMTGMADVVLTKLGRDNEMQKFDAKAKTQEVSMRMDMVTQEKNYVKDASEIVIDTAKRESDIVIDTNKKIAESFLNLTQTVEEWLNEFDKQTNDLGKSYGYTNKKQLDDFQNSMFTASEVAAKFGKKIEDVVKLQQSFIESTGRNKLFGRNDYDNIMRLGSYLGDDGLAASYTSEMEIFNAGVSDSVDMLGEVLNDVNRMGLNGRKYTKTLVENLKLAQKYNFKGGTKGLMEMAKWAENTRFNMGALSSQLDKISEGGLEGVITQGAQFQVLGGHAAMNADPIAMMFERYADPQALMKRYQDMTKGYGRIDKKTGETIFSVEEQMLMEQIAKVRGISTEDVMNEVRARNKRETVAKHLNGSFNEDQQAFISNNATYNKERGTFQVKVKRGDEYEDVDVDQLSEEDLKEIMPADYQEHMLKNMDELVPLVGKLAGEKERQITSLAKDNYDQYKDEVDGRIEAARTKFAEQYETYTQQVSSTMAEITGNFKSFLDQANTQNEGIAGQNQEILARQKELEAQLGFSTSLYERNNDNMKKIVKIGGELYEKLKKYEIGTEYPTNVKDYEGNRTIDNRTHRIEENVKNEISEEAKPYLETVKKIMPVMRLIPDKLSNYVGIKLGESMAGKRVYDIARDIASADGVGGGGMRDGIISNNNRPMVSAASNVTKINDGLVSTHPNDVGIFAKEGGVIGKFLNDLYNDVHNVMFGGGGINANTLKVEMSGSLDLQSAGQSINIITELQNNPMLLRALSQLLVAHMTNAINGGRGTSIFGLGSV